MIRPTLTISTSEGERKFGLVLDSLKDLAPILREFDKVKRERIAELFESGGQGKWPEPSAKSQARGWKRAIEATQRAPTTLLRKLTREYGRAISRSAGREGVSNAVARRRIVLAKFERLLESGGPMALATFEDPDKRLEKSVRGLQARLDRGHARAGAKGRVLGNLPQTIRSAVRGGTLTIDSSWDSPAPNALNEGATVGGGAKLFEYRFLEWTPKDAEALLYLLRERAMIAWES